MIASRLNCFRFSRSPPACYQTANRRMTAATLTSPTARTAVILLAFWEATTTKKARKKTMKNLKAPMRRTLTPTLPPPQLRLKAPWQCFWLQLFLRPPFSLEWVSHLCMGRYFSQLDAWCHPFENVFVVEHIYLHVRALLAQTQERIKILNSWYWCLCLRRRCVGSTVESGSDGHSACPTCHVHPPSGAMIARSLWCRARRGIFRCFDVSTGLDR